MVQKDRLVEGSDDQGSSYQQNDSGQEAVGKEDKRVGGQARYYQGQD
jgi:hypothetical protein